MKFLNYELLDWKLYGSNHYRCIKDTRGHLLGFILNSNSIPNYMKRYRFCRFCTCSFPDECPFLKIVELYDKLNYPKYYNFLEIELGKKNVDEFLGKIDKLKSLL